MKPKSKLTRYRGGFNTGGLAKRLTKISRSPLAKEAMKSVLQSKPATIAMSNAKNYFKRKVAEYATPSTAVAVIQKGYELMKRYKKAKPSNFKVINNEGTETTKSVFVIGKSKPAKSTLLYSKYVNVYDGSKYFACGTNAKAYYDTFSLAVPLLRSYASKMATSPSTSTQSFYMKSSVMESTYTNMTSTIATLTLYDYTLKRDACFYKALDIFQQGMQQINFGTLSMPWWGLATTPFDSPLFKHFCSVKNKVVVNMAPGSVHIHKKINHVEKSINVLSFGGLMGDMPGFNLLRDITTGTLASMKGTPVLTAIPIQGITNVEIGSSSVAVVYTVTDNFAYASSVGKTVSFTESLSTSATEYAKEASGATRAIDPNQT